jgi:hypothetical protein
MDMRCILDCGYARILGGQSCAAKWGMLPSSVGLAPKLEVDSEATSSPTVANVTRVLRRGSHSCAGSAAGVPTADTPIVSLKPSMCTNMTSGMRINVIGCIFTESIFDTRDTTNRSLTVVDLGQNAIASRRCSLAEGGDAMNCVYTTVSFRKSDFDVENLRGPSCKRVAHPNRPYMEIEMCITAVRIFEPSDGSWKDSNFNECHLSFYTVCFNHTERWVDHDTPLRTAPSEQQQETENGEQSSKSHGRLLGFDVAPGVPAPPVRCSDSDSSDCPLCRALFGDTDDECCERCEDSDSDEDCCRNCEHRKHSGFCPGHCHNDSSDEECRRHCRPRLPDSDQDRCREHCHGSQFSDGDRCRRY